MREKNLSAGFIAGILCSLVVSTLYSGFIMLKLWGWFVVPLGVGAITLPWAIGLCIMISAAKGWPSCVDDETPGWEIIKPFFSNTLFLVLGYIVQGFM
jgi:hypothetical protein